jgi:hypothetical protein
LKYEAHRFQEIQHQVQKGFIDNQPPHLLESARGPYDPKDDKQSSVYVVTHAEFQQKSTKEVQEIFRHRHILITGAFGVSSTAAFNEETISDFADLGNHVEIQGGYWFDSFASCH